MLNIIAALHGWWIIWFERFNEQKFGKKWSGKNGFELPARKLAWPKASLTEGLPWPDACLTCRNKGMTDAWPTAWTLARRSDRSAASARRSPAWYDRFPVSQAACLNGGLPYRRLHSPVACLTGWPTSGAAGDRLQLSRSFRSWPVRLIVTVIARHWVVAVTSCYLVYY